MKVISSLVVDTKIHFQNDNRKKPGIYWKSMEKITEKKAQQRKQKGICKKQTIFSEKKTYWKNIQNEDELNFSYILMDIINSIPSNNHFPFRYTPPYRNQLHLTFNSTDISLSVCFVNQCKTSDEIYRSVNFLDLSQTYLNVFRTHIFYEYVYTVWTQRAL